MQEYGLKLWSTNKNYLYDAVALYNKGVYHYIELFSQPNSYDSSIQLWTSLNIPFVIHAAHSLTGLNLSRKDFFKQNAQLIEEAKKYADVLKSDIIILHPGLDGDIEETVFQFNKFFDKRMLVENKPEIGLNDEHCIGHSWDEIKYILDNVNIGFCLDIGHAIHAANSKKINPYHSIKKFLTLDPSLFHLSDGNINGIYDEHLHFGEGDFDLPLILSMIPDKSKITVETDKNSIENLNDFENDILYLNKLKNNIL
jgi:deoxyribonuclease-4